VQFNECKILFLILVTLPFSLIVYGQEEFIQPSSKLITSFAFKQFSGGVVVVKAQINNISDSLNFILDTGSGGISLDSSTCEKYNILTQPSDKTIRGIAGLRTVRFAYNNTMYLPGLRVDSLNFHINDYEILSSVYGEHIDGIIGYSFLIRYIVKINYDSSRISVFSKGTMKYPKGGFLLKPLLVSIPIQGGRIKEQAADVLGRFYFDIGAGLCLLLSTDFASDSLKFSPRKKMFHTQAEGLGGKAQMKITTIKEFRLGPYRFRKVPAYIFDDDYNVTSYPYLGGLIGNDLLRRFNVILNYEKRDIHLIPNSHYRDPFDYAYTGLSFYAFDGEIRVTDIMENSPAAAAGFQVDDIIVAINNNFSKNVQVYRNILQSYGEKLKVLISRNGFPMLLTLKVKSIL
jgi:hypothetical protein